MGGLLDATHLLWCRRLARHVRRLAIRDWEWTPRDPNAGAHRGQRACDVEDGPL